jgi:dihydrolipoamide dehydrogenase
MIVIGSGVIGLELGSVYRRLGSEVVVLGNMDRICPFLDSEVSMAFKKTLEK